MAGISIDDKRALAKSLFINDRLDQKVVAARVKVSERTMGKWVADGNWKMLRKRLLLGKENLINKYYDHLENLNKKIDDAKQGHGDSKQADIMIKYTAAINNLETDLGIQDLVEAGMRFIRDLQKRVPPEKVLEVTEMWNDFIHTSIKR